MLAHKIELKPNNKQTTYFKKACGIARFSWNWGLANWERQYKEGLKPTGMFLKKEFNAIKKEQFLFTYEVTKYVSQQPFIQLQDAYNRFFKKLGGKPKFKKKGKSTDSFYIGKDQIKVIGKKVKVPNLGWVRLREEVRFAGSIASTTISRTADKWFIAFAIRPAVNYRQTCKNQASVGIDLGVKHFAVLSNGSFIDSPKPLKASLQKLKRLSRQLSRKQHSRKKADTTPKANNYVKYSMKVARLHKRIHDVRTNFLHKITSYLTDNFQYISVENLNVKGMMANSKLARVISDVGMYEFKRQLFYFMKNNILFILKKINKGAFI